MIEAGENDAAPAIAVELRLSDEALTARLAAWIDGSATLNRGAGAASEVRVLIADHLPQHQHQLLCAR